MPAARYELLDTNSNQENNSHKNFLLANDTSPLDQREPNEELELQTGEHCVNLKDEGDDLFDECRNNIKDTTTDTIVGPIKEYNNCKMGNADKSPLMRSKLMQLAIGSLASILLYLSLSICLTFYQKALIKKINFPLTIVIYHLIIKYTLAAFTRSLYKWAMGRSRVQIDWRCALRRISPTGIASGIDIGFSNWGLELVPISLYTMTKSSTIIFILFFAILFGLEKKTWSLVFIVGLIAIGLFMFTYKSTQFDALGFIFILTASLSSGVRWSLAQFIMQKSKLGLHNPIDMIYYMQPWMILSILPFFAIFEAQKLFDIAKQLTVIPLDIILMIAFKITFGAFLAFFMEISEFLVLSKTSSLTLSIAGIFKDICQLALAVELNGDQMSLINALGLVVCLAGICCHVFHKYSLLIRKDLSMCDERIIQNKSSRGTSSGAGVGTRSQNLGNIVPTAFESRNTTQNLPLLDHMDSDDSGHDDDDPDASEVLFDVIKRRDM